MAQNIILIPDSVFFVKTMDAPKGLADGDIDDFVETAVETFSPIPADRLAKSFFKKGGTITVFSTLEEKVKNGLEEGSFMSAPLIIPASALLSTAPLGDGILCFDSGESISAIEIKDGLWTNFAAVRKTGAGASDMENLRALANFSGPIGSRVFKLAKCEVLKNGKISCEIAEDGNGSIEWQTSRKDLLTCDLRDKALIRLSEKNKRKKAAAAIAVKAVPAVFALLLLWQVSLFFKESGIKSMQALVNEREPMAKTIEMQSEQIGELRSFTSKKLHSIANLAFINSLRPEDILFSQVTLEYPADIIVRGTANSIGTVEAFTKALKSSGKAEADLSNISSVKDQASFTLSVKLK